MKIRFVVYGLLGWAAEIVWTALESTATGRQRGWRLEGRSYLWMFPIYGLMAPLLEPLHEAIRGLAWPGRAVTYALGFLSVEYLTGWLLRKVTGSCPWDYTGRSSRHVHGLIRLDYAPLWALLGLLVEPVHDYLVRVTPALEAALPGNHATGRLKSQGGLLADFTPGNGLPKPRCSPRAILTGVHLS